MKKEKIEIIGWYKGELLAVEPNPHSEYHETRIRAIGCKEALTLGFGRYYDETPWASAQNARKQDGNNNQKKRAGWQIGLTQQPVTH